MNLKKCTRGKWIINTSLGSGKSTKIIEMANNSDFETPHLIVVDTKEEVDRYRGDLPGYDWFYQTKEKLVKKEMKNVITALINLRKVSNDTYFDFVIKGIQSKLKRIDDEETTSSKGLIITKAMFNEYLKYQYENPLSKYKTITIDELSNLEILSTFKLKDEYTSFFSNEPNFKESLFKEKLKQISCPLIENPRTFFEELVAGNSLAFLKKTQFTNETEIVMKNIKLFKLLNSKDINIQILDATANFHEYFYNDLSSFKRIDGKKREYKNLTIQEDVFDTGYLSKISNFRVNYKDQKPSIEKKLNIINSLDIKSSLVFSNKDTIEVLKKKMPSKTLDYFYSGNDIGTNKYKDNLNLCILYGQRLNKEYIDIISYYFKVSNKELEKNLIAARTIQLIGRTAIRNKSIKKEIKVNIIHFPELDIDRVLKYYRKAIYKKKTITIDIEDATDIGKIMQHIAKKSIEFKSITPKERRLEIRKIISILEIPCKDIKSKSNLVYRVIKKLKAS